MERNFPLDRLPTSRDIFNPLRLSVVVVDSLLQLCGTASYGCVGQPPTVVWDSLLRLCGTACYGYVGGGGVGRGGT